MDSFYYSMVGLLALVVHLIINQEMFSKTKRKDNFTEKNFHIYLISILFYYITDILWGVIDYFHNTPLLYCDTVFYYIAMALSVVFCCRYVISFLNLKKKFSKILQQFGRLFCIAEFIVLIINLFYPIFFYFDSNGKYHTGTYRYIALIVQIVMFTIMTIISFYVAFNNTDTASRRSNAICSFGLVMTFAIICQTFYPLLPLYSIGLMLGSCILHVFVQEDVKREQMEALESMAAVFYSMHIINLENDTVEEFNAFNEVKQIVNHKHGANDMMKQVMKTVTSAEYLDAALKFTDLTTVADRMKNKNFIGEEFVGNRVGWFNAMFITVEADSENKPVKLIYATRIIDEEKKQKEKLIRKTQTDEMTGLLNRRAYEEDIYAHNDTPDEEEFVYVSIDVNGLKIINDTNGHLAGDELIVGACQCMKETMGAYGKLYRIGGDEFVAILLCNSKTVAEILADFDNKTANWTGELIKGISVSYGWVSKNEEPSASVRQLGEIAEKRMYIAKSAHYSKQGVDRRGQQNAHKALCELYTKILKINLSDDSYQIVNIDEKETLFEKEKSKKISEWLYDFGKSGRVHPEDMEEYLRLTDFNYMKEYFKNNKTSLHIFYRRKYEEGFKQVMMEIITADDYSDDNQNLFLYVKNIDK